MTVNPTRSRLLLFPEVAERLRKTDAQLRWLLHTGIVPKPARIGGRLVWTEDQIEEFIAEQFAKAAGS